MENSKSKGNLYIGIVLALMAVALGVQSFLIYKLMNDKNGGTSKINANVTKDSSITLIPRIQPNTYAKHLNKGGQTANSAVNGGGSAKIALPPLPRLNVNMNGKGGKPVITAPPQTAMNQPRLNPFPQVGGNISAIRGMMRMNMRDEMERMRKMMDSMFNMNMAPLSAFNMNLPPISMGNSSGFNRQSGFAMRSPALSQKNGEYVFKLNVPGMDKSGIKANINGNILTIFGTKKTQTSNQGNTGSSYTSSYSSFQNSFPLPGPVKANQMKMNYDNNILTIRIPKA